MGRSADGFSKSAAGADRRLNGFALRENVGVGPGGLQFGRAPPRYSSRLFRLFAVAVARGGLLREIRRRSGEMAVRSARSAVSARKAARRRRIGGGLAQPLQPQLSAWASLFGGLDLRDPRAAEVSMAR